MNTRIRNFGCAIGIVMAAILGMAPSCPQHTVGLPDADRAAVSLGKHEIGGVATATVDLRADADADPTARIFLPSTALLTPPYSVQVTVGFPDPADAVGFAGHAGLECRVPGSSPLDYHGVYIRSKPGGIEVFARVAVGGGLLQAGSAVFAGTSWVDLLILNNGSGVYFRARKTGDADFTQVLGQPAPPGVFSPGIAAYDFGGGQAFSFFDLVLSETSDPEGGDAYAALADALFQDACFPLQNARSLAAGPNPDIAAAGLILDDLAAGFGTLVAASAAFPTATAEEQEFLAAFQKSLGKFYKALLKAQKAAGKGKSPAKAIDKAQLLADALVGALRAR